MAVSSLAAQTLRSGQALGVLLSYYDHADEADVIAAVNDAVEKGADVINMSIGAGGAAGGCNAAYNSFGSTLTNALNSGAVPVRVYNTCAPEGRIIVYSDSGYDLRHFRPAARFSSSGKMP